MHEDEPGSIAAPGFGAASSGSGEEGNQDEEDEKDWGHGRLAEIGERREVVRVEVCVPFRGQTCFWSVECVE